MINIVLVSQHDSNQTLLNTQLISTHPKQYSLFSINFLLDKEPRKLSSDEFNSSDDDHIDVESRSSQGSGSLPSSSSIRPSVIKLDGKCDKKGMYIGWFWVVDLAFNLICIVSLFESPSPFFLSRYFTFLQTK